MVDVVKVQATAVGLSVPHRRTQRGSRSRGTCWSALGWMTEVGWATPFHFLGSGTTRAAGHVARQ